MALNFGKRFSVLLKLFLNGKILKALLSQYHSGYLVEEGWFNSLKQGAPVDKSNNPIPWLSYSCVDFLRERLHKNLCIFEFGSGNSTLYYSTKVKEIICVEHDPEWFQRIKDKLPGNAEILFREYTPGGEYSQTAKALARKFDLIIVDGVDRVNAVNNSIDSLSENGVLILDDSERKEYEEGIKKLLKLGYKRLDFWGISAGELYKKCTSVFYRENNCLKI